jgi:acetyl esterase
MALHPQAVAALDLWTSGPRVGKPGYGEEQIAGRRRLALEEAAAESKEPVDHVEDIDADGVRCRLYRPEGSTATIVHLHGGGFVFGDIDTHDGQSRRIANRTGMAVLAVDYRRPPEDPFPAAPDDVDVALSWLLVNASAVGLDIAQVVALGDSAGGNLALVAALRNPNAFAATVLIYPLIDAHMRFPSYRDQTVGLNAEEAGWYWRQYARTPADYDDADLAPITATVLGTLPPTLVIAAEHDVLVDENVELARRIQVAGGTVELSTYAGMIHGFWRHPTLFDASEESLAQVAGFVRRTLA